MIQSLHPWLVRRVTYPLWQRRRRGRVLPILAGLEGSQWLSPVHLDALRLSRLQALLTHAHAHSPFYREAMSSAGVVPRDIRSLQDLQQVPVLDKAALRDRGAELMTNGSSPVMEKRQTSGSTGVPILVWAGPEARDAWAAATLRFTRWWKVEHGDRRLTLISRHELTRRGWFKQYLFANVLEFSAMDLTESALARVIRWLTRGRVRLLVGYPTSLAYLAHYALSTRATGPFTLRAVVTTGEMLYDDQRALLQSVFHCPVVNEYGCSETGHIAGECALRRLHIAAENVVVEIDRSPPSTPHSGSELLITDLTNRVMPLIRYRIGDLGELGEPCPCGRGLPVLQLRVGRTSDLVILPDGRRSDFSILSGVLDDLAVQGYPLKQYRVIQHAPDHFEVLLALSDIPSGVEEVVRRRIPVAVRAPVRVTVRAVSDIPPDRTGKRRRFISHVAGR